MKNNGSAKLLVGVAIGTAIGAAIAYLSDADKRERFVEDVSEATDKMRDNIKDAYYETRIRGRKARRDLSRYLADVKGEAEDLYEDVVDRASRFRRRSEERLVELQDMAQEDLEALQESAEEVIEELKN